MDIRNCRSCGNIFNYVVGPPICPSCREKKEEDFQRVKAYVREHPGVNIRQVADDCEVELQQIKKWLREERLEITGEASATYLDCERCGAPIRSGRYCDKCKYDVVAGLNGGKVTQEKPSEKPQGDPRSSAKMRFLS